MTKEQKEQEKKKTANRLKKIISDYYLHTKQKKVEKAKRKGEKQIEKNVKRYMKHMGYL